MCGTWQVSASVHYSAWKVSATNNYWDPFLDRKCNYFEGRKSLDEKRHFIVNMGNLTGTVTGDHDGSIQDIMFFPGNEVRCTLVFNHLPDVVFQMKGNFTKSSCQTVVSALNGTKGQGKARWTWTRTDSSGISIEDDINMKDLLTKLKQQVHDADEAEPFDDNQPNATGIIDNVSWALSKGFEVAPVSSLQISSQSSVESSKLDLEGLVGTEAKVKEEELQKFEREADRLSEEELPRHEEEADTHVPVKRSRSKERGDGEESSMSV